MVVLNRGRQRGVATMEIRVLGFGGREEEKKMYSEIFFNFG